MDICYGRFTARREVRRRDAATLSRRNVPPTDRPVVRACGQLTIGVRAPSTAEALVAVERGELEHELAQGDARLREVLGRVLLAELERADEVRLGEAVLAHLGVERSQRVVALRAAQPVGALLPQLQCLLELEADVGQQTVADLVGRRVDQLREADPLRDLRVPGEVGEGGCQHVLDSVSSSEWPQGVELQGEMRALSRTVDARDRRRGQWFRMKLSRAETIGVQYVELERMAGTTMVEFIY